MEGGGGEGGVKVGEGKVTLAKSAHLPLKLSTTTLNSKLLCNTEVNCVMAAYSQGRQFWSVTGAVSQWPVQVTGTG